MPSMDQSTLFIQPITRAVGLHLTVRDNGVGLKPEFDSTRGNALECS